MRALATLMAAGLALAPALAGAQTNSTTPSTAAPPTPSSSATSAPESTAPVRSATSPPATPSASSAGVNAQATEGAGGASATVAVGNPVKDNTGATIGEVTALSTSNGQPTAVIKMGTDSFQVPTDRLGVANGAATINMTQAQIEKMLHPAAGGR